MSDAFEERQQQLIELFKTDSDDNIYYLPCDDFDSQEEFIEALPDELAVWQNLTAIYILRLEI